jgi:dihydroflavonol-4-reductase
MKKQIFLTGTSGFIGSNLTEKLLSDNSRIYALVRKPGEPSDNRIKTVKGDILKPESYASAMKKCDVVFHCAADISFRKKDFQKAYKVNVEGTINVLEAAYQANVRKFVYLSACAVLGFSSDKNKILDENEYPEIKENNVYAFTKRLAEEEVRKYVRKGLDASIANIATVYGQGDRKLNSGAIIKSVYEGKMKLVPPGGTSFVSVDDLVEGLMLLSEKGKPGERYIFCTENMEYKTLVRRIARTLGVKEPKYTLPGFSYYPALLAVKGLEVFSGLTKNKVNLMTAQILKETYGYKYFSSEKAKKELEWKPLQSFEEAVKKAFNYYKKDRLI